MSKIKNGELDQYGTEPFEQLQFETAGVEGVNIKIKECADVTDDQRLQRLLITVTEFVVIIGVVNQWPRKYDTTMHGQITRLASFGHAAALR